ncbi:MAG: hypothetical protein ACRC46_08140 [Thermoguttaceae bacterium]
MTCVIGTDEAGYGPNIGPLVIAATRWCAPPAARGFLRDSKKMYHSGGSLARLEAACLGGLAALGHNVKSYRSLCDLFNQTQTTVLPFWEHGCDVVLPCAATQQAIDAAAAALGDLDDVRLRIVFPEEFNCAIASGVNKSTLLSRATLSLVAGVLPNEGDVFVRCDKHGGRNKYASLLNEQIDDGLWETSCESLALSEYRCDYKTFVFCAKGESFPEVALASLYAKYCRELSMRLFNEFWQTHVADIAPTAGYPVDAARFRRDISATQHRLNVRDETWWRIV